MLLALGSRLLYFSVLTIAHIMPNKKTISSLALMNSPGTAEDEEVEEEVLDGDDSGSSSVTTSLSDKS